MIVDWTKFKEFVDSRNTDILMIEENNHYHVHTSEGVISLECLIDKTPSDVTDLNDFEDNYKSLCNLKRQVYDPSGKPFARFAIAKEGNTLHCLVFTFKTSTANSLRCKEIDNTTNKNEITYKMYDSNGDETTTNANCVLTRIIFEPTFNYEIIGGRIFQKSIPSESVYAYMIAIPDISKELGGSREMCGGGFDLSFIGEHEAYGIDGRAPKELKYSSENHTNKIHLDIHHSAGFQHELMFKFEMYK